jgi:hypothetical protein
MIYATYRHFLEFSDKTERLGLFSPKAGLAADTDARARVADWAEAADKAKGLRVRFREKEGPLCKRHRSGSEDFSHQGKD